MSKRIGEIIEYNSNPTKNAYDLHTVPYGITPRDHYRRILHFFKDTKRRRRKKNEK